MDKINVLFMQSQAYFGADSMIHSLLMRNFGRTGLDVHVACEPGTPEEPTLPLLKLSAIPQIHVRPTYFGPSAFFVPKPELLKRSVLGAPPTLASLVSLAGYIRKQRIQIIHCTEKPRDAFYGFLLAKACQARCVIHLHVKAEPWISPLVRWAMKRADGLIGISEFVSDSMRHMGYDSAKIYTVLNSMDLAGWGEQVDGSAVRREFGISPDTPLLSIISRLFHWKGHTELLRALPLVKQQVGDFKLLIVGDDDPRATIGNGSYTAELKALANELGVAEHLIFTGYRRDVANIMAASDIFTMPSFEEPFGMVFLEAMALRRPVVALNNGGTPEVVEHGRAGLLSQPKDIQGLAANIVTLIQNPALRREMGEYGRCSVEERFNPRCMADDMERVYRDILSVSSPVSRAERSLAVD